MNNNCIKRLLINRLKFPKEIIEIIKDWVFITLESKINETRRKKNNFLKIFDNYNWHALDEPGDRCYTFWIESDPNCPQFFMKFCVTCGDYDEIVTNYAKNKQRVDKVVCYC